MGDHSTNVIPFNFGKQQVRTLLINELPWFVATDVCAALSIVNTARALSRLDEDEKGVHNMNTLGGAQTLSTVNESGLYSLILTSRKAEAKRFKKWVTAEVLPAIRKHGRYEDAQGKMSTLMGELSLDQLSIIKGLIRDKAKAVPAALQQSFALTMHSRLRTRFNVARSELIPANQFEVACNFIGSYALDGEYIPRQSGLLPERLNQDERYLVSADPLGNKQVMPVPMDAYVLNRREFMKAMLVDEDMPVSTEEMFQFVAWATENLRRRSLHQASRRAAA